VVDPDLRDLSSFRGAPRFKGGRGLHGQGALKRGADGEDVELRVPAGTQILDAEGRLVADLAHAGARAVVARGGLGGSGNKRFASPTNQAPRVAEVGQPGEEAELELRLKLLADAALLGFPNAGKSSLLRRISNAKPKVADYPFTTLAPVLGTVESSDGRQLTVADVPGLVEGAHQGVGLGDEFLAHLERARLFVHVIDVSEDVSARFHAIDAELRAYGAGLVERPQIVALNKVDLLPEPPQVELEDERVVAVVPLSAVTGAGIEELRGALFELVPDAPEPEVGEEADELVDFLVYRPRPDRRRPFRIFRGDRGFQVSGAGLDAVEPEELERALKAAGAKPGDDVTIGDEEFTWE
jgi:GTPase